MQSEKFALTDTECKVVIPRDCRGKGWGGEPDRKRLASEELIYNLIIMKVLYVDSC